MDQKEFDEFLLRTMKENNPNLKTPKKSGSPTKKKPEEKDEPQILGFMTQEQVKDKGKKS